MHKHIFLAVAATLISSAIWASAAQAQEWGDLEGQFVYKGTAPANAKIVPDKDVALCGKHMLTTEKVVVHKENGGLANVVVFLFPAAGAKVKVHPDLAKPPAEGVVVDNKNCRFAPHVSAVRTGQKLIIGNGDPVGHNTKAELFANTSFNEIIP